MQFLSGILTILDRKERGRLFLFIFFDVLISALDIAFLALTILVVDFYIKGSSLPYLRRLPQALADRSSVNLIALFFILFGFKNVLAYIVHAARFRFIYRIASRLSERNIRHYLRNDYLKFVNVDSSAHIRRISHGPIEFSGYMLINLQQIISQSILVLLTICAILIYHATLFLLLFLLLAPALVFLGWLLKRQSKNIRKHMKATNEQTLKNLKEALGGYIESNIYGKDDFFANRYYHSQHQMNGYIGMQQSLQSLPSRLIEVFAILGFFILIVINKWSARPAGIDLLTIGVFIAAAYKIIPGMVKILNSAGQMKTYEYTIHDLLAFKDELLRPKQSTETIRSIKMENISYKYHDHQVLNPICAEMVQGDFAGISGNSGRGKTTLMHILLGFIEQKSGEITINQQIKTATERQDYSCRISYIKQQPFLIHDTVRHNITLQEDGYHESKLREVISFCGLDTLLAQYPEGDQFVITENGKNLSGGQRQRLMLARAMYHDFDLLILDEPFGEIDQASERSILQGLKNLADQGKMILFITHNKASLSFCNKIISLDD